MLTPCRSGGAASNSASRPRHLPARGPHAVRTRGEVANFRGGLAGWQQKKVADFIEEHLDEDITLQQVAEVAQLSRYHFARAFKQSFGLPPHRYHMSRRMERAKELLQERTRSVTQVGLMLGFAETSSFTTSFRRAVGITPSDYRRTAM